MSFSFSNTAPGASSTAGHGALLCVIDSDEVRTRESAVIVADALHSNLADTERITPIVRFAKDDAPKTACSS